MLLRGNKDYGFRIPVSAFKSANRLITYAALFNIHDSELLILLMSDCGSCT